MAGKNGKAEIGPGHNSQLTDEEKRALTLHHKRKYEAADALVEKAKGVVERFQRLARWSGLKVGTQPQLFEAVQVDHHENGKTAGMCGDTCEPPKNLAQDATQLWIAGWHEGQTVLMAAFKKKRPVDGTPAARDGQIDLEDAIAKFGERIELTEDEIAKGYNGAFVKDGNRVAMQLRA